MRSVNRADDRGRTHPAAGDEARERGLLQRIAAGDRAALEQMYLLYHRRLARFLVRLTYRHELAEEIINDTLWIVWQRSGEFRGASRVSTWIVGIAYRCALQTLRHVSVRPGEIGRASCRERV